MNIARFLGKHSVNLCCNFAQIMASVRLIEADWINKTDPMQVWRGWPLTPIGDRVMLKKNLMTAFVATMAFGTLSLALAQDRGYEDDRTVDNSRVAWADVLRVDPVYDNVVQNRPREECYDADVNRHYDGRGNNAGGTVLGAIVGGALGNQVGKGDGRKAATIAGALIGGAIGNDQARRDDRYYTDTETRCRTISERSTERRIVGYDVQYRYRGDVYISQLDYDPGERMRVRVNVTPAE